MESLKGEAAELLAFLSTWQSAAEDGRLDAPAVEEGNLTLGIMEVGFASSRFICRFAFGRADFCAEILLGPDFLDAEESDRPLETVRAALQTARLIVCLELGNCEWLAGDPEATVQMTFDVSGAGYRVLDCRGRVAESGKGWKELVERLDGALAGLDGGLCIVNP